MRLKESCAVGISTPIHENDFETAICSEQRLFVCQAANSDDKVMPAGFCQCFLALYPWQFHFHKEFLWPGRLFFKVIRFDVPWRARDQLKRVELPAIDEHVPAGEAVLRKEICAVVMRVIAASVRHRDVPALRALRGIG